MGGKQLDLIEESSDRALLDRLLDESRLYKSSNDYLELLDFVVRMRNFAPFNSLLLQIQKKGLRFAASQRDWRERFGRTVKEHARPLIILWTFGPVGFVYDIADTEGDELPVDIADTFRAFGDVSEAEVADYIKLLTKKNIWLEQIPEFGDAFAGQIRRDGIIETEKGGNSYQYRIATNASHSPGVQFATLVHELGHLFLGHLGADAKLAIRDRSAFKHVQVELEAESVSYLVCERRNVKSESHKYLSQFVSHDSMPSLDVYQVMKATGKIESLLKMTSKTSFLAR